MYNNNSFLNRGFANPYYMPQQFNSNFNYQQPIQQQQPIQKAEDLPIQEIRFLTADEIKAFIVFPNNKVMLVDKANGLAYIKWADAMGQSNSSVYSFAKVDSENPTKTEYASKDDLKEFLTKEDLKAFETKIDKLQTQIRLSELFTKEESKNV